MYHASQNKQVAAYQVATCYVQEQLSQNIIVEKVIRIQLMASKVPSIGLILRQ